MKKAAIIVAGGTGTRMNADIPKQFLLLGGKPLLFHSLETFYRTDPGITIILVLPESYIQTWRSLCNEFSFPIPHMIVSGGETRFHSVRNALPLLNDEILVGIHDGARPLVSSELIIRAFAAALQYGNCIPALPVSESVRVIDNGGSRPVDRRDYRIIQTPQVFGVMEIREAYKQPYNDTFTDDATVLEGTGKTIHLIEGEPFNIKVTCSTDMVMAECLLNQLH